MMGNQAEAGGSSVFFLLESYVLHSIGELDEAREERASRTVRRAFGGGSDWRLTLRLALQLPAGVEEEFRQLWRQNREIAQQEGEELTPTRFAQLLVQENFAPLLEQEPPSPPGR